MLNFSATHLEIIDWGRLEYGEALVRQKNLAEEQIKKALWYNPNFLVYQ